MIFRQFILYSFLLGCSFCALSEETRAPALIVKDSAGTIFDLSAHKGKVVIIQFWASWCPQCREEMPVLEEYYRKNKARGLEILAVSIDKSKDIAKASEIALNITYPTAIASNAQVNDFSTPSVLPLLYIIDRKGFIAETYISGEKILSENDLAQRIEPLLKDNEQTEK